MATSLECPICGLRVDSSRIQVFDTGSSEPGIDLTTVLCKRCGDYRITGTAVPDLVRAKPEERYLLSSWVREQTEFNRKRPEINSSNWKKIVADAPEYSVREKTTLLLRAIERRSNPPGRHVALQVASAFDGWSDPLQGKAEFHFHAVELIRRNLVASSTGSIFENAADWKLALTHAGWELLEALGGASFENQCFVAMSFAPELLPAWEQALSRRQRASCGSD